MRISTQSVHLKGILSLNFLHLISLNLNTMENNIIKDVEDGTYNALSLATAQEMTFAWQDLRRPDSDIGYPKSYTIDRADFIEIFNQPHVVSVRAYPGVKTDPETGENVVTLIFVGVDNDNNDIIPNTTGATGIYDFAFPCPSTCGCSALYKERNDDCNQ
ncbi:MAG: hypothetical protein ACJA1C_002982 [Crocinitomicaceae bacterium]|jgi:hypothetical protein